LEKNGATNQKTIKMILTKNDIVELDQRYRTAFINSLAGFRQAVLIGTKSAEGNSNLAIFNSLIHLGANPALFGLINRPDSVQRDTLQNIKDTKEYTLNFIKASEYKKAHQTSARYDKGVSEFNKVGFTERYKTNFIAPFVSEAIVQIAMKLEEIIPIAINGTILIIGSIQSVEMNDELAGKDGFVNLSSEEILISQGLDAYFTASLIGRLDYAKP
jgi:flavin reductase (DIM6/NTAB) family NADH-FMN oxidoreductase RutF